MKLSLVARRKWGGQKWVVVAVAVIKWQSEMEIHTPTHSAVRVDFSSRWGRSFLCSSWQSFSVCVCVYVCRNCKYVTTLQQKHTRGFLPHRRAGKSVCTLHFNILFWQLRIHQCSPDWWPMQIGFFRAPWPPTFSTFPASCHQAERQSNECKLKWKRLSWKWICVLYAIAKRFLSFFWGFFPTAKGNPKSGGKQLDSAKFL